MSVALSAVVTLAACLEDYRVDPEAGGGFLPDGAVAPGDGGGGGGGGDSAPVCKGDTLDACGPSCMKCAAPKDGHAACTNAKCEKLCDAKTLCTDACVDMMTSSDHCGKCGHSCGGGQCLAGVCQPVRIAGGLTNAHAIDLSPTAGVVISADKDVVRCDAPGGCTPATLKAVATGFNQLNDMVVAGTDVYFIYQFGDFSRLVKCPLATGCPAPAAIDANIVEDSVNRNLSRLVVAPARLVYAVQSYQGPFIKACNLPGCTSPSTVRVEQASSTATTSDTSNPITTLAASSTEVLYGSAVYGVGGVSVRACAFPSCGQTPTNVGVGNGGTAVGITFFNGKFYFATSGGSSDAIWTVVDGATTKSPFGADSGGISDIAVDASGVYWSNATTGKILKCDLTGCPGGTLLAAGQTGAARIRVDAKFVYWMTPTAVLRLAK
ncbi:MAG: Tryptophan synthase alpha chain [Labilithrix sp.]|nr:Tryptophan synthase alpha chain [Labilithrix sp.]